MCPVLVRCEWVYCTVTRHNNYYNITIARTVHAHAGRPVTAGNTTIVYVRTKSKAAAAPVYHDEAVTAATSPPATAAQPFQKTIAGALTMTAASVSIVSGLYAIYRRHKDRIRANSNNTQPIKGGGQSTGSAAFPMEQASGGGFYNGPPATVAVPIPIPVPVPVAVPVPVMHDDQTEMTTQPNQKPTSPHSRNAWQ